jgi:hypothetical protein
MSEINKKEFIGKTNYEIEKAKATIRVFEKAKEVIQRFDGKAVNKRFDTALREETDGQCMYRHYEYSPKSIQIKAIIRVETNGDDIWYSNCEDHYFNFKPAITETGRNNIDAKIGIEATDEAIQYLYKLIEERQKGINTLDQRIAEYEELKALHNKFADSQIGLQYDYFRINKMY